MQNIKFNGNISKDVRDAINNSDILTFNIDSDYHLFKRQLIIYCSSEAKHNIETAYTFRANKKAFNMHAIIYCNFISSALLKLIIDRFMFSNKDNDIYTTEAFLSIINFAATAIVSPINEDIRKNISRACSLLPEEYKLLLNFV